MDCSHRRTCGSPVQLRAPVGDRFPARCWKPQCEQGWFLPAFRHRLSLSTPHPPAPRQPTASSDCSLCCEQGVCKLTSQKGRDQESPGFITV